MPELYFFFQYNFLIFLSIKVWAAHCHQVKYGYELMACANEIVSLNWAITSICNYPRLKENIQSHWNKPVY